MQVSVVTRLTNRGVEIVSRLLDILAYFHHSFPAPHILCIQFSFNLPDIHCIYRTMSCITGCFHTTVNRGVEIVSRLPDILTSCPGSHILCIQFSFNLPDIHCIYRTMSCITGCFHTTVNRGVEIVSRLPDILTSCPGSHTLCMLFSFRHSLENVLYDQLFPHHCTQQL